MVRALRHDRFFYFWHADAKNSMVILISIQYLWFFHQWLKHILLHNYEIPEHWNHKIWKSQYLRSRCVFMNHPIYDITTNQKMTRVQIGNIRKSGWNLAIDYTQVNHWVLCSSPFKCCVLSCLFYAQFTKVPYIFSKVVRLHLIKQLPMSILSVDGPGVTWPLSKKGTTPVSKIIKII